MATKINADTIVGGAVVTADASGILELQSAGTTALTLSGANATFAGSVSLPSPLAVAGNSAAGAEIRLPEDTDNGSNYVALKAPNALASNLTLTLPTADGTNGQYLRTDGTGQLSFATVPTTSPAGSTGQVQYNNAGAFGAISSGTSGQVLTSAGAGAPPAWANLSQTVVLIASSTLSSSAAQILVNNIPVTSYSSIIIEFMVRPDSSTSPYLEFVAPGGTSSSGLFYGRWSEGRSNNAGGNAFSVNGLGQWYLNPLTASGGTSEFGAVFNVQQTNQTTTKRGFYMLGFGDTNASVGYSSQGGGYHNTGSWGGFRLLPGSGTNFLAGSYYRIYGVL